MEEEKVEVPMWVAMVVTMLFGAFCWIMAFVFTTMSWRQECVKRGLAKWTVVNDDGRTEWDWISK
jgi:hypothetical protein